MFVALRDTDHRAVDLHLRFVVDAGKRRERQGQCRDFMTEYLVRVTAEKVGRIAIDPAHAPIAIDEYDADRQVVEYRPRMFGV